MAEIINSRYESQFNVAPNRQDVLKFAPLILSALYLNGLRGKVNVSTILAVYEDASRDLARMEWGELIATVQEALRTASIDPRRWQGRANKNLIPTQYGYCHCAPVAALAVSDETLATLVVRFDAWNGARN